MPKTKKVTKSDSTKAVNRALGRSSNGIRISGSQRTALKTRQQGTTAGAGNPGKK